MWGRGFLYLILYVAYTLFNTILNRFKSMFIYLKSGMELEEKYYRQNDIST